MDCDFLVIGGGMAGASSAALLAADADVLLLERESQPGYHSTGRSAAIYIENYGNATVRKLNRASRSQLAEPDAELSAAGFLTPRGELYIADAARAARLDALIDGTGLAEITPDEARAWVPLLRPEAVARAAREDQAFDIDVHALHSCYLQLLRRRGGRVVCDAAVSALRRGANGRWRVDTEQEVYSAAVVVNAAGAWADDIAELAGAARLGLQPLRRSAVLITPPVDVSAWPTVVDVDETFYCKPDAGRLMISPADATPVIAQDVAPDELDLAHGINAFEQAIAIDVRRIGHRWAGLRTFAPDNTPVVGFDPDAEGLFWCAGLGGYGIQTAPAMAGLAAALALGRPLPQTLQAERLDPAELAPARLR